jgi:hypothetical protein
MRKVRKKWLASHDGIIEDKGLLEWAYEANAKLDCPSLPNYRY